VKPLRPLTPAVLAGLIVACGEQPPAGPGPVQAAPVVSAVTATALSTGAIVKWTTDQPATSQVEYGPTTAYGRTTPLDSALVTSHSVEIGGLAPGAIHHFRVKSNSGANLSVTSANATLTTASEEWDSLTQFSGMQGANGWRNRSYLEQTNSFVDDLSWNGRNWQWQAAGSDPNMQQWPSVEDLVMRPGTSASFDFFFDSIEKAAARSWRPPTPGDYRVILRITDETLRTCNTCNGADIRVWTNSDAGATRFKKFYPPIGWQPESHDLGAIALGAGDEVHVVVFNLGDGFNDAMRIRVTIVR
jgi:hypothetical protein